MSRSFPQQPSRFSTETPVDIRIPQPAFDFGHFLVVGDKVVLLNRNEPVYQAVGIETLLAARRDRAKQTSGRETPNRRFSL